MADQRMESADEAAAYWRAVAAMTKPPERTPDRGAVDEEPREIDGSGSLTDSPIEPGQTPGARASSASPTARSARRRL